MKQIINKENTDVVSSTWPYGKIRDDSGANDGTPVNADVYQDHHQFFSRLMDLAGITPNNQLDNASSGFQLHDAYYAGIETLIKGYLLSIVGAENVLNATYYFFGNNLSFGNTKIFGIANSGNPEDPIGDNIYTFVYQNGSVFLYDGNPTTGNNPQFGFKKGFKTIKWRNDSTLNTSLFSSKLYSFSPQAKRRVLIPDITFVPLGGSPTIQALDCTFDENVLDITMDILYGGAGEISMRIFPLNSYRLRIKGVGGQNASTTQYQIIQSIKDNSGISDNVDPDIVTGYYIGSSNNSYVDIECGNPTGVNYRGQFSAKFILEKY